MTFCQIIVGAPGAGKSTYCNGMQQFLKAIGRQAVIVNVDPANENLQYDCHVNVTDLITVEDVMDEYSLGPNGALLYCIEWLEKNMSLLKEKLVQFEGKYLLFDFPGQAELYTSNVGMRSIAKQIEQWGYRPVVVHLVDSQLCVDPSNFISAVLMSLSIMIHLELPHVNILSKADRFPQFSELPFNLDFYSELSDISYLLPFVDPAVSEDCENEQEGQSDVQDNNMSSVGPSSTNSRGRHLRKVGHHRLISAISELVTDYGLVGFKPLSVTDKYSMHRVLHAIDKGNGYIFANDDAPNLPAATDFLDDIYRAIGDSTENRANSSDYSTDLHIMERSVDVKK